MRLDDLLNQARVCVAELYPWDLAERLRDPEPPLLLDIREADEFQALRIAGSMHVARGFLEQAVEWDFAETIPELIAAREREIIIICRSGNRSLLAGYTLHLMGFANVSSLATGLKGWNDYDQELVNDLAEPVDGDTADEYLTPPMTPEQLAPSRRAGR